MNEGIKTDKKPQIEQFGDIDFNDESSLQRNDLGGGSAEEALRAQPTEGDAMNEDNVEASSMSEEPQTEVSPKETATPIDDTYPPDRSLLLSFKFHRVRSIYLGQVVWDPYRAERRSDHDFNENTLFNRLTSSPDHVEPICPNRVVSLFARIQPIPKNPKCVEVSGLRTWDGDEPKQYKPKYDWVDVFSKGLWKEWIVRSRDRGRRLRGGTCTMCRGATKYKQLRVKIEKMKQDRILNDVVHEQYVKSFKKLLAKLEENVTMLDCVLHFECQVLNVENTKLVEDMRIKIGVDASNASLAIELAKQRRKCKLPQDINAKLAEHNALVTFEQLVVILKEEAVPSRDLQKKIDELTVKYADAVKRWVAKCKSDTAIHDKKIKALRSQLIIVEEMKKKLEVEHYEWKVWRQAMKKEFHSRELAEKDDLTFIELFDQYDRFYTIAQQGPKGDYQEDFTVTGGNQDKLMDVRRVNVVLKKKINGTLFQLYVKYHLDVRGVQGEDGNSAFRVPTIIKHQSQSQFKKVMNSLKSLLTKDPTFWKTVFSQSLDTHFSLRGEMVYEQLRRACSYDGQHVEYRHMGHLLATCYEKVVVFISNHEAYTFLPLFWLRKNNHISNEKRFENLVEDTTKFWWVRLGSDNQYVRLFTRYRAPMPPISTLWLAHVDLGLRGDFQRDMLQKWFGVTNKLFKVFLKESNVKGYKLNDLI
ncbi:hypothetical protein GIB67_030291 [Kingdonia uniflora]|uniref:Uncharacterized protein n=1 Tax=Kingdonia uniflora TaxID=39325 RepID=A0A7J7M6Q2_9MAGN|nr:hypothetical protein GIB67_030291 [Kingdonia uniflora]